MKDFLTCGLRQKRSPPPPPRSKPKSITKPKPKSIPNSMLTLQSSRWCGVSRWLTATSTTRMNSFFQMIEIESQRRKMNFLRGKRSTNTNCFLFLQLVVIDMSRAVADLLLCCCFSSGPLGGKELHTIVGCFLLVSFSILIHFFSSLVSIKMSADGNDLAEWYTSECGTSQYTLPRRYQDLSPIGQGAFGAVMWVFRTSSSRVVDLVFLFSIVDASRATDMVRVDRFSVDRNRRDASLSGHGQTCGNQENASTVPKWNSRETNVQRTEITHASQSSWRSSSSIELFSDGGRRTFDRLGSSIVQCFYSRERCQWLSNIVSRLSVSVSTRESFS